MSAVIVVPLPAADNIWHPINHVRQWLFSLDHQASPLSGDGGHGDAESCASTIEASRPADAEQPTESQTSGNLDKPDIEKTTGVVPRESHIDDIGLCISSRQPDLDDDRKLHLLNNPWTPNDKHAFPRKLEYGKHRSFCIDWLKRFPWLVYKARLDGAFCRFCVLFEKHVSVGHSANKLGQLMTSPLMEWTSAVRKLTRHEESSPVHKDAVLLADNFVQVMSHHTKPETEQVDTAHTRRVKNNKLCVVTGMIVLQCKRMLLQGIFKLCWIFAVTQAMYSENILSMHHEMLLTDQKQPKMT